MPLSSTVSNLFIATHDNSNDIYLEDSVGGAVAVPAGNWRAYQFPALNEQFILIILATVALLFAHEKKRPVAT